MSMRHIYVYLNEAYICIYDFSASGSRQNACNHQPVTACNQHIICTDKIYMNDLYDLYDLYVID